MLQNMGDSYLYREGTLHCSIMMEYLVRDYLPLTDSQLKALVFESQNELLIKEYEFMRLLNLVPHNVTYTNIVVDLTMLAYLTTCKGDPIYYGLCGVYSPQLYGIAEFKHSDILQTEVDYLRYYDDEIASYLSYLVYYTKTEDYIANCKCNSLGGFDFYLRNSYTKSLPVTSLEKSVFILTYLSEDISLKYGFYESLSDIYNLAQRLICSAHDLESLGAYKNEVYNTLSRFVGEYEMLIGNTLTLNSYKLSKGIFSAIGLLSKPFTDAVLENLRRTVYHKHELAVSIGKNIIQSNKDYVDWQKSLIKYY